MTWPAEQLRGISAATLHESGATPLPPQVHPLDPGWRVCGRAFTVDLAPGHNIWLHRAVYAAQLGPFPSGDATIEYYASASGDSAAMAAPAQAPINVYTLNLMSS